MFIVVVVVQATPQRSFMFHSLIHIEMATELAHQNRFINKTIYNSIQIIKLFSHKNDNRVNFSHSNQFADASLSLSQSIFDLKVIINHLAIEILELLRVICWKILHEHSSHSIAHCTNKHFFQHFSWLFYAISLCLLLNLLCLNAYKL